MYEQSTRPAVTHWFSLLVTTPGRPTGFLTDFDWNNRCRLAEWQLHSSTGCISGNSRKSLARRGRPTKKHLSERPPGESKVYDAIDLLPSRNGQNLHLWLCDDELREWPLQVERRQGDRLLDTILVWSKTSAARGVKRRRRRGRGKKQDQYIHEHEYSIKNHPGNILITSLLKILQDEHVESKGSSHLLCYQ